MEQFHLIIRKTTNGLNTEYSSPGIDPDHPDVEKTLEDERAYVTQIVRDSDVYSLEITNRYRIYSLIVTDIDKFGRAGYYEFKLYGPKDYPLENFDAILQEIKETYNQESSKKPYESILSTILLNQNNSFSDLIPVKRNNKKYYSFYDEANLDSLKEVFRDKGLFFINKIYALNKAKAYDENLIISVGLLPFSTGEFREVVITNPHHVLKELFLNNEKLDINNFRDEIKILVGPKDILTYSTLDSRDIKPIRGSLVQIEKKQQLIPHTPHIQKPKKKSFFAENAVYLLALVIMIGGAGWAFPFIKQYLGWGSTDVIITSIDDCPQILRNSKIYMFDRNIDEEGEHYITSFRNLGHYTFTYKDSLWIFKNSKSLDEYRPLNKKVIKGLKTIDTVPLNLEEQKRIIKALEGESGKTLEVQIANKNSSQPPIPNKNIEKINSPAKTETVKKEEEKIIDKPIQLQFDSIKNN